MANISIGGRLSLLQRVASLDLRYGPYSSITDAYENMGPSGDEVITAGLPFGVTEDDGSVSVYIWTKGEDATKNDCKKLDKEHIILFNGFIDISVSIKQQSYNDVATKSNIVFLSDRKQFAYRDGLNFYINWKNRYVWSNENLIPYDDVIYIDINNNKAYHYNGTTLTLLVSEAFVSSVNNQAPDANGNVNITKEHIGLGNVDNTADMEKVVKGASEDGSGNNIVNTYETKNDATTKQTTLQGAINALQTSVAALTGLDSTNFGGFSIESTEADAISNIATLYTADGYTDELLWYMAGASLSSVKAYRYNGSGTPTAISSDTYNCVDFSGLIADVNTLRQDLDALGPKIDNIYKEESSETITFNRGGIITFNDIELSSDGDSIEFELQTSVQNAYIGRAFCQYNDYFSIGLTEQLCGFRKPDNTNISGFDFSNGQYSYVSQAGKLDTRGKLRIAYENGCINLYVRGILVKSTDFNGSQPTIKVNRMGTYTLPSSGQVYYWLGTIYGFKYTHNGTTISRLSELEGYTHNESVAVSSTYSESGKLHEVEEELSGRIDEVESQLNELPNIGQIASDLSNTTERVGDIYKETQGEVITFSEGGVVSFDEIVIDGNGDYIEFDVETTESSENKGRAFCQYNDYFSIGLLYNRCGLRTPNNTNVTGFDFSNGQRYFTSYGTLRQRGVIRISYENNGINLYVNGELAYRSEFSNSLPIIKINKIGTYTLPSTGVTYYWTGKIYGFKYKHGETTASRISELSNYTANENVALVESTGEEGALADTKKRVSRIESKISSFDGATDNVGYISAKTMFASLGIEFAFGQLQNLGNVDSSNRTFICSKYIFVKAGTKIKNNDVELYSVYAATYKSNFANFISTDLLQYYSRATFDAMEDGLTISQDCYVRIGVVRQTLSWSEDDIDPMDLAAKAVSILMIDANSPFENKTMEISKLAPNSLIISNVVGEEYDYTGVLPTIYSGGESDLTSFYALWDAFATNYPEWVTKEVLGQDESGTYDIVHFTIDPKTDNFPYTPLCIQNNLKILVVGGVHSYEYLAEAATYAFFKDLLENHDTNDVLGLIWQNAKFEIIVCANPYGFVNATRSNVNGVNINRNFGANWVYETDEFDKSGETPDSEAETQIIEQFILAHPDAFLVLHPHTSSPVTTQGFLAYMNSYMKSDIYVEEAFGRSIDKAFKKRWPWLLTEYPDIKTRNLFYPANTSANGCLNSWANGHGYHSFVFEQAENWGDGITTGTRQDLLRSYIVCLGILFRVFIQNNEKILASKELMKHIKMS